MYQQPSLWEDTVYRAQVAVGQPSMNKEATAKALEASLGQPEPLYSWPNAWAPGFQTDFKSGEIGRERNHLARDAFDAKTSQLKLDTGLRSGFNIGLGHSAFDRRRF